MIVSAAVIAMINAHVVRKSRSTSCIMFDSRSAAGTGDVNTRRDAEFVTDETLML